MVAFFYSSARHYVASALVTSGLVAGMLLPIGMSGCAFAPRSELTAAQSQNHLLAEQNQSQLAEMENLKNHNHKLEDKLIQSEEQLAVLDKQLQADQKRLVAMQTELSD